MSSFNNPGNAIANAALTRDLPLPAGETECTVFDELRSLVKKTVALHEPIRDALEPFEDRILLAALYGSVAEHKDTASSDIDLLVVSDELTLEQLYSALAPTEDELARKINPTLYTLKEFDRRKKAGSGFLGRILAGEHIVLIGEDVAA